MKIDKYRFTAVFAVLSLSIFLQACGNAGSGSTTFDFTQVRRGNVERTVTASGTINPVATVKVLPQMSGKVEKLYVDFNDTVHKGDILAELNTDMLRLQRDQQNAAVVKARANLELQQINYNNQLALAQKNLISEYELKSSKTTLDNQTADLAVAEANLKVIETEINQYAYITCPIDGIVLDRKINVGDTVVDSSSSSSSAIFTLAENLSEMQIEAVVGELDVASISRGQPVRFSLESMPGRSFTGVVDNLRMVPVVTSGVVSYTVMVRVENLDGSLFPGMTCSVDFIVERSENVLLVSNASLRYTPTTLTSEKIDEMVFNANLEIMDESEREAAITARAQAGTQTRNTAQQNTNQNNTGITGLVMGGGARMGGGNFRQPNNQGQQNRSSSLALRNLWYFGDDGKLEVMRVQAGISDGTNTEIIAMENIEGKEVILRERINAGN